MSLFTPDEYVLFLAGLYPTVFVRTTYEDSKFRVLDRLLNVNGNGIRNHTELERELRRRAFDDRRARAWLGGAPIWEGTDEVQNLFGRDIPSPGAQYVYVLEEEKPLHPEVKLWRDRGRDVYLERRTNPYPNFKKEFSILYNSKFLDLSSEWLEAARWFYLACQKYFEGDCDGFYETYPKKDTEQNERLRHSLREFLQKYKTHEEVSAAYGVEYRGDLESFLCARWDRRRSQIQEFLTETIALLDRELAARS